MAKIDINDILSSLDSTIENVLQDNSQKIKKTIEVYQDEEEGNLLTKQRDYIQNSAFKIDSADLSVSDLTEEEKKNIANKAYQRYKTNNSTSTLIKNNQADYGSDSSSSRSSTSTSSEGNVGILGVGNTIMSDNAARNAVADGINKVIRTIGAAAEVTDVLTENVANSIQEFAEYGDNIFENSNTGLGGFLNGVIKTVGDALVNYQDGVSETSFGQMMEDSWYGGSRSNFQAFLNYFQKQNRGRSQESRKINILSSTPLDPGEQRTALYGSMMLGAPFLFNRFADPNNRSLINTLIKDGKFLTLTPGFPKYNGTSYTAAASNNILKQTTTADAMLDYVTKNGLDKTFADKDKRYYTFKTDYEAYFAYLETMLNAVWVKLGLAKNGSTFNLFSFFNIKNENGSGGINPDNYKTLLERYQSSIGFFTNIASALSESISNSQTGVGAELADKANAKSTEYQRLNYITGMGGGGAARNTMRKIGIGINSFTQALGEIKDAFGRTSNALSGVSASGNAITTILKIAKVAASIAMDVVDFNNNNDLGALIQSFATTNGMKVMYPELWSDSSYSKNLTFNFNFTSPYGDPLSIFKYVYVPFFALLAFGMPRQAAENGYVSPFLVRAHVPGLFTSDLAFISDITWTKGGGSALWTKDGLPRSIDVSITLTDLYPYLSMTKRLSYLSANPSYTVFLDSFAGMLSATDNTDDDSLNRYFEELLTRVNGQNVQTGANM